MSDLDSLAHARSAGLAPIPVEFPFQNFGQITTL